MAISDLTKIVPPPKKPNETGTDAAWLQLEKDLGISLPIDWRDFGVQYGTGVLCGIKVFNPYSQRDRGFIRTQLRDLKLDRDELPYAVHPETPGLLPFAGDSNGNNAFWLTEGKPELWPIILQSNEPKYERWDLPMTTFLAKVLSNEIKCILWKGFTKKDLVFKQVDF